MSIEPGIADTNVLVYALDADAPQHEAARALLEAAREASTTLFVTSQILCEFYSVVTNPRRVSNPRSAADAAKTVRLFPWRAPNLVVSTKQMSPDFWLHCFEIASSLRSSQ